MRQAERAVFDLHRGLPVLLGDETGDTLVQPVESLTPASLARFFELGADSCTLLLTRQRLAAMSRRIIDDSAALAITLPAAPEDLLRLAAHCGQTLAEDVPLAACTPADEVAVRMLRRARILPAGLAARVPAERAEVVEAAVCAGELLRVRCDEAAALCSSGPPLLIRAGDARVPLAVAGECRFLLFRESGGLQEHVAVLIGDPQRWPAPVPVRLHCACLTGDVFGSQRCDCGEQLQRGIAAISAQGGGIVLYLDQEGRGIGLGNKLRAYRLQDEGLDTVDADRTIGFGDDERDFRIAHDILEAIGVRRVTLLTNNPAKIAALSNAGTEVSNQQALFGRLTDDNRRYLTAKADRQGHLLRALLDEQEEVLPRVATGAERGLAP